MTHLDRFQLLRRFRSHLPFLLSTSFLRKIAVIDTPSVQYHWQNRARGDLGLEEWFADSDRESPAAALERLPCPCLIAGQFLALSRSYEEDIHF